MRGGHNRRNASVVEAERALDVMMLARAGCLNDGRHGSWTWSYEDGTKAIIELTGGTDAIDLHYRWRRSGEPWHPVEQRVPITWQPCRFGGARPWFVCACSSNGQYCGRRVGKLYGAGRLFACRHCWRLNYATQRGNALDRSHARLSRIYRRLGTSYEFFEQPPPRRPKGMWRRTYTRLLAELEHAEAVHEFAFEAGAARIMARIERLDRRRR